MSYKFHFASGLLLLLGVTVLITACEKDVTATTPAPKPAIATASFVEEFTNAGELTGKGWVLKNNSNPIGQSGWRQGRYESSAFIQGMDPNGKFSFFGAVPYVGFPAHSAQNSPNEFISCDVTAVNGQGDISAWLISPSVPISNGDQIIFYTRATDDSNYPVYTKDRMQVRANFTDGTANVGTSATTVGSFSSLLLDINSNYIYNDPGGNGGVSGYPRAWTKYTITISGLTAPVSNARFAFRYLGADAGLQGGSAQTNYPTVIGIDSLAFVHK
jgi:hypothetical protein